MDNNQNTNTFEFINNEENIIPLETETKEIKDVKIDAQTTEDFVTGLPSWDLTPPYEIIRRVSRK
ncbi:MAG: hypothetical protein IJO43_03620 [Bacilli bacterium]|nr:hypothetical protein [Bacilli bacterium]